MAFSKSLIENSCNWISELIASGYICETLFGLIIYTCKEVNISNPNIPIYMWNRFKLLYKNYKIDSEDPKNLRNNMVLRNTCAEFVSILCLSSKNKCYDKISIDNNDFDEQFIKTKLNANNFNLIQGIINDDDPTELSMIINEFAYNLYNKNINMSFYWLYWLIEWDKVNIKKYGKYICAYRKKFTKIDKYATILVPL